jgi:hypothetical protein
MGGAWRNPESRPLSINKTIFCRLGDVTYGLPLIVEELNKYNFRATFFTEVFFSQCLGDDQAKIVIDYLLEKQQDVQLHAHPVFRNYSLALREGTPEAFRRYRALGDALSSKDIDTQYELLSEASVLFRSLVGVHPVAFRAGGFRGDHNTLVALLRLGILIDSSYNPSIAASFPQNRPLPNIVQRINEIIEMPLTNARSGLNQSRDWKPMAISSVSFAELKAVLKQAHAGDVRDVVLILHPFSMVKAKDFFYSNFRPDRMVISRFRRLLRYLADHSHMFEVCVIGDAVSKFELVSVGQKTPHLDLGFLKPLVRKGAQALNRVYWI